MANEKTRRKKQTPSQFSKQVQAGRYILFSDKQTGVGNFQISDSTGQMDRFPLFFFQIDSVGQTDRQGADRYADSVGQTDRRHRQIPLDRRTDKEEFLRFAPRKQTLPQWDFTLSVFDGLFSENHETSQLYTSHHVDNDGVNERLQKTSIDSARLLIC